MLDAHHIVIVDDDREIRGSLSQYLEQSGFRATGIADARSLERLLARQHVDLVVLDARLPDEDGFTICRRLSADARLPIIMLAATGDDLDRIVGLEMGADDYLTKPFNPRELVARARNVLRRWKFAPSERPAAPGSRYQFGQWTLDTGTRELTGTDGGHHRLTGAEYRLLLAFVAHPNRVLTRQQLLRLTKGRQLDPFDRSIDVRVSRLRQLLQDNTRQSRMIKTVYGDGYVFATQVTMA